MRHPASQFFLPTIAQKKPVVVIMASKRRAKGESRRGAGKKEDAEDELSDADSPTMPKKKIALGNAEKKMAGQKAQEYFKTGLALSKKAKNKREYAEALDAYTMAITLKSSNARYYFARGNYAPVSCHFRAIACNFDLLFTA